MAFQKTKMMRILQWKSEKLSRLKFTKASWIGIIKFMFNFYWFSNCSLIDVAERDHLQKRTILLITLRLCQCSEFFTRKFKTGEQKSSEMQDGVYDANYCMVWWKKKSWDSSQKFQKMWNNVSTLFWSSNVFLQIEAVSWWT